MLARFTTFACGFVAAGLTLMPGSATADSSENSWRFSGDFRSGYVTSWRNNRDGSESSDDSIRARLRLRLAGDFGNGWSFTTRLAGSYAGEQDDADFYVRRYRPSGTGVNAGDTTIDEFYLGYRHPETDWRVRIGRFQSNFNLPVVPGKSLDRNDASSFGVGWTDGFHLEVPVMESWRVHLIGQANDRKGTGNTIRGPIDFRDSGSRASVYAALAADDHPGPFIMRMLTLNWMPDSLAENGLAQNAREDYLTLTAKAAVAWPLGDNGMRFVAAGEIGHALNRPDRNVVGLTGSDEVSGNSFQTSLNLVDIRPGHSLGTVYGRVQPGWLISNDFRNNDELAELRYQYRPSSDLSIEIRYRWRRELEIPLGAPRERIDRDMYARVTLKF